MMEESHIVVLTLAIRQNMYAMSELAQELIKNRAHAHGWSIETYPGKVKLPSDIFKPLPNVEAAKTVSAELCSFLVLRLHRLTIGGVDCEARIFTGERHDLVGRDGQDEGNCASKGSYLVPSFVTIDALNPMSRRGERQNAS